MPSTIPALVGLAYGSLLVAASPMAHLSSRAVAIAGWDYSGCFTEAMNRRTLSGSSFASDQMTLERCSAFCNTGGFSIFGVEYGRECYCGNALLPESVAAPDTDCNFACPGDSSETCGAGNRLNVYNRQGGTPTSTTSTSAAPVATSYAYDGCYTEATGQRALSSKYTTSDTQTIANCAAQCAGYSYFGLEYYFECFCGNALNAGSVPAAASDCSYPCNGDSTETCGGSNRLSIYAFGNSPPPSVPSPQPTAVVPTGLTALGCYTDSVSSRALMEAAYFDDAMTIEKCSAACNGYALFGVEYARECYCGNQLVGSSQTPIGDCNFQCSGNSAEKCGAGNRLNVYQYALIASSSSSTQASSTVQSSSSLTTTVQPSSVMVSTSSSSIQSSSTSESTTSESSSAQVSTTESSSSSLAQPSTTEVAPIPSSSAQVSTTESSSSSSVQPSSTETTTVSSTLAQSSSSSSIQVSSTEISTSSSIQPSTLMSTTLSTTIQASSTTSLVTSVPQSSTTLSTTSSMLQTSSQVPSTTSSQSATTSTSVQPSSTSVTSVAQPTTSTTLSTVQPVTTSLTSTVQPISTTSTSTVRPVTTSSTTTSIAVPATTTMVTSSTLSSTTRTTTTTTTVAPLPTLAIVNPGFESGLNPWTTSSGNSGTGQVFTTQSHTGTSSYGINNRAGFSQQSAVVAIQQSVTIVPGRTYQASIWVEQVTNTCAVTISLGNAQLLSVPAGTTSTTFVQYTGQAVVPANTQASSSVTIRIQCTGGGRNSASEVYVDDIQIVQIN